MKSYPLVDLEKTDTPVFWVYNNLAYVYRGYKNSNSQYYVMGDYQVKPKLDDEFRIISDSLSPIIYFQNESFEWVLDIYYNEKYSDIIESSPVISNWNFSPFSIECFSVQYDLVDTQFPFEQFVTEMYIYDYEKHGFYPNSEQLDLLVKKYLIEIEPDWTFGEHRNNTIHFPLNNDSIYYFFEHHFDSYQGDVHDFIKHCLEITNEIWQVKNKKNIKRQKYFNSWLSETLNNYPEIDPKKFYNNCDTPKVANDETITIDELNSKNISGNYLMSDLYVYLNTKAENHKGNIYDYLNCIVEVTNNNWGDLMQETTRKNIFQWWLKSFIMYNRLDKTKLNINSNPTPEPPQPVESVGIDHKKLTLTGSKVAIYHVFKQLIAKKIIGENAKEVAEFLVQNMTGFENSDIGNLATEITRDKTPNNKNGTAPVLPKYRIDLD